MNLNKIAGKIIRGNIYLSLSTSDGEVNWNTPLWYAASKDNNFYFVSDRNSRHSKLIKKNPYVSGSIFNSKEKPEKVNGVQFDGLAEVVGIKGLPEAIKVIYSKRDSEILKQRFNNFKDPKSYTHLTNFRIFRVKPLHFYILDPRVTETDKRVEVEIS